jgi:glucose/arabinose dehydrogenase
MTYHLRNAGAALVIGLLAACDGSSGGGGDGSPGGGGDDTVELTRVFSNVSLSQPLLALQPPGDDSRWYVVEQGGLVKVFPNAADATASTFVDLSDRIVSGGERGLLGMAFDPAFPTNGRVFMNYTRDNGQLQTVVSSFVSLDDGATLDAASEQVLLTIDQPFANHNGGNLVFGGDGLLYVGTGDGGSGGDPLDNGQDPRTLLGKLLRLDVSAGSSYAIPSGNPHSGNATCANGTGADPCPEIFALGFRNPWRFSFDRSTGELWLADVGQSSWEEVDRVVAGGNYGWRFREGAHCFEPATGCPTEVDGQPLIDPVAEYDRGLGGSVTGGYVYRGTANPGLVGRYVFGDFSSGRIFGFDPASSSRTPDVLLESGLSISSFAEDADGEIYVIDYSGGLYRAD